MKLFRLSSIKKFILKINKVYIRHCSLLFHKLMPIWNGQVILQIGTLMNQNINIEALWSHCNVRCSSVHTSNHFFYFKGNLVHFYIHWVFYMKNIYIRKIYMQKMCSRKILCFSQMLFLTSSTVVECETFIFKCLPVRSFTFMSKSEMESKVKSYP